MATVITKTVKPSGGDYTLVSAAYADAPSSLVSSDEQWDIICDTFTGGLSDGFDAATKTCDATRFIRIAAASGHEYKHWDGSGFFMTALRNFDGVITSTTTKFLRIENVGFKNTGTTSARGLTLSSDDTTLSGVYATTAGTAPCFNLTGGVRWSVSNCLAEEGSLGFSTGSFTGGTIDKCTVIDSSNGYSKGGASRQLILTDSLYVGAGSFISGTNNFDATSDYNASSDTGAIGANSLQNRTTSDLADYVSGDYRTASASALATAGSVDFIGYALESSSGISITESLVNANYTSLDPVIALTGVILVTENTVDVNYASLGPTITLTGSVSITEKPVNTNYTSLDPTITLTGTVSIIESVVNVNYESLDPLITLSSQNIQITEQAVNVQYQSLNPSILLTPEPLGIVSTVCFSGVIESLINNGTTEELEYSGNAQVVEFSGSFNELEFNGTIQTSCNAGSIKTNC